MTSLRQIASEYFDSHPEAKMDATRKGMTMLRSELQDSHHYEHKNGKTKCWICGDDWYSNNPKRCPGFQHTGAEDMPAKINRVLVDEYWLYMKTIAKYERMVRSEHKDWLKLTGEKIAVLHHTHGCGVEELEWILDSSIPRQLRMDYESVMETERSRSRSAQVKQVIAVQIT